MLSFCELIMGSKRQDWRPSRKTVIDRAVQKITSAVLGRSPAGEYADPSLTMAALTAQHIPEADRVAQAS